MQTPANWTGEEPIIVTATVSDLGGPLPAGHTGDARDLAPATRTWTITANGICPTYLEHNGNRPPEPETSTYLYKCKPELPGTSYENTAIIETLSNISSGNMFSIDDLTIEWRRRYPAVANADQAAIIIFDAPVFPITFQVNGLDVFKDDHLGMMMTSSYASLHNNFTPEAILGFRVGNLIHQTYQCGEHLIGASSAKIYRVYDGTLRKAIIKKEHDW